MNPKLRADLERLQESYRERAQTVYAILINKAPVTAENDKQLLEWCADDLGEVIRRHET